MSRDESRALALAQRMIDGGHLPIDALMTASRTLDVEPDSIIGPWVFADFACQPIAALILEGRLR